MEMSLLCAPQRLHSKSRAPVDPHHTAARRRLQSTRSRSVKRREGYCSNLQGCCSQGGWPMPRGTIRRELVEVSSVLCLPQAPAIRSMRGCLLLQLFGMSALHGVWHSAELFTAARAFSVRTASRPSKLFLRPFSMGQRGYEVTSDSSLSVIRGSVLVIVILKAQGSTRRRFW